MKQFQTKWVIDWTGNDVIDVLSSLTSETGLLLEKVLTEGGFKIQPHANDESLYRVTVYLNTQSKGMAAAASDMATKYLRLSNFGEDTEVEVRKAGTEKWKTHVVAVK